MSSDLKSNDVEFDGEQDDLQTDCAPHTAPLHDVIGTYFHTSSDPFPKKGHFQPERYDSGIGESLKSQDLVAKQLQDLHISSVEKVDSCELNELPRTEHETPQNEQIPNEYCLANQVDIVYAQDAEGDTQLHLAIIQQMLQLCLYFINIVPHYDFLNIQNDLMQTVLHLAVMTKMPSVVRRLIVAGADVTFRDHRGDTPLHIASRSGDREIVGLLLEPVSYQETLQNSYKIPYQRIPQNLELRNYNGQTCLHVAAEGSYLEVLQLLLSKGSDINTMDGKSGRTVLHYAAETGNEPLLNFLLQNYRVKVDARTYGGQTPLMLAQGRGHHSIVRRLMEAGAVFQLPREDSDSDDDMDESKT